MWPHRRQPTRLCRPWDSLGKNTGVVAISFSNARKWKAKSEVHQACPTVSDPMDCSPPGSSVHGIFQQDYWSGLPLSSPLETTGPAKNSTMQRAAPDSKKLYTSTQKYHCRVWGKKNIFTLISGSYPIICEIWWVSFRRVLCVCVCVCVCVCGVFEWTVTYWLTRRVKRYVT